MVTAEHILQDLNPPQREAVTTIAGPLLILAGPGSGKTRVIAHRIAYLVDVIGVAPWRICRVTFTNKAAREMQQRVVAHLGDAANDLVLGTFHSICARFLRIDGERIGLPRSFNIYDDADQMALMKRALRDWANVDTEALQGAGDALGDLAREERAGDAVRSTRRRRGTTSARSSRASTSATRTCCARTAPSTSTT